MNNRMMIIYINESYSPYKISTITTVKNNPKVTDILIETNQQFTYEYTLALNSLIDQSMIFAIESHELYKKSKIYEGFLKEIIIKNYYLNDCKYYLKKYSKYKLGLFSSKSYHQKCTTFNIKQAFQVCKFLNSSQDLICNICSCSYKDHCLSRFKLKEIILEKFDLSDLSYEFQSFTNDLYKSINLPYDPKNQIHLNIENKIQDIKENICINHEYFEYFFGDIKDYTLENSQLVFVIGEEGSGKTTLIRKIINNQDQDSADKFFDEIKTKSDSNSAEGYKVYNIKKKGYLNSNLIIIESPGIKSLVNSLDTENIQSIISMIKSLPSISTIIYTHKSDTRWLNPSIFQIRNLIKEEVQNVNQIKFIYVLTFYPGSIVYNDKYCEKNSLKIKINMRSSETKIIKEKSKKDHEKMITKVNKIFKEIVYCNSSDEMMEFACKIILNQYGDLLVNIYKQTTLDYVNVIERYEMDACIKLDNVKIVEGFDLEVLNNIFENSACKICGKGQNSHIASNIKYDIEPISLKDLLTMMLNPSSNHFIENVKKMLKNISPQKKS
ncbi:hypothetical protein SteCoe_33266 [Stentor coeruleus]|uniref:Uncharacterized protein n=1 Tax=Stentor coeruleus TaxID=5963 RepID=A0A1R2AX57_9CILI|nr:hypothetical protein SteCoe_33266 [Stentor coeruleus]